MSKISSLSQCFDLMPERFMPDKAAGESGVFQFDLSGDQGGKWYLVVKDGQLDGVVSGEHASADIVMSMSADDWLKVVNGEANPMMLFMQGGIKISGDIGLALKMQKWFKLSAD